jgi:hypothetical protein
MEGLFSRILEATAIPASVLEKKLSGEVPAAAALPF